MLDYELDANTVLNDKIRDSLTQGTLKVQNTIINLEKIVNIETAIDFTIVSIPSLFSGEIQPLKYKGHLRIIKKVNENYSTSMSLDFFGLEGTFRYSISEKIFVINDIGLIFYNE